MTSEAVFSSGSADHEALSSVLSGTASWSLGCLPPRMTAAEIVARKPNFFSGKFPSPAMLLHASALEHNVATMADYCRENNVLLAPHGKTTMAPQLIARQLAAGAWGVSAATINQIQVYRAFGIRRIMLANQLVDPGAVEWLAAEMAADPGFEFLCYVDSIDGVRLLEAALGKCSQPTRLPVLVELGVPGGRAGCRSQQEFLQVARAASESAWLHVAGSAGYEGSVAHGADAESLSKVASFLRSLREVTEAGIDEGVIGADQEPVIVSAGGSAYFDVVVENLARRWRSPPEVRIVLRCGAYIGHDSGVYATISPFAREPGARSFRPALEAWGRVLSRPEPELAIVDVGRRNVPADQGLPVPQVVRRVNAATQPASGFEFRELHDQHGFLRVPAAAQLSPGDWVGFGISHPCTAFDKWRVLLMVDDSYNVIDCIRTFF